MSIPFKRLISATLRAVAAFLIACLTSCVALTWMVRNSHDGQAGMGAAFGAFYLGCIAAIVTFFVSFRRSSDRSVPFFKVAHYPVFRVTIGNCTWRIAPLHYRMAYRPWSEACDQSGCALPQQMMGQCGLKHWISRKAGTIMNLPDRTQKPGIQPVLGSGQHLRLRSTVWVMLGHSQGVTLAV